MDKLLNISQKLTSEFISECLTKWFNEDTHFVKFEFGDETGKGDSYLSDIYRITFFGKTVKTQREVNIRVIVKGLPSNLGRRKTFKSTRFFQNEINFYSNVLPVLLDFQSKKKMTDPFDHCPRVFGAFSDGLNDFIVVEDLSVYDFKPPIRQEGCDYNHMKIILKCFAKLHALSFAFNDQCPDEYVELKSHIMENYFYKGNWDWYKKYWKSVCLCAIDAVEKEYPGTVYEKKIRELATEQTYWRLVEAAATQGNSAVFSHGDSWIPNFLFQYGTDNCTPEGVKMIDFQLARCASPILDISFFIYACSTEELRKLHYQNLLKYYYEVLSTQIKDLGSDPDKIYSWDMFNKEVKKFFFFGLAFSLEAVPCSMLSDEDAWDMDAIQGDDVFEITEVWIVNPIKTKEGRLRLANNIVHGVDNGYI